MRTTRSAIGLGPVSRSELTGSVEFDVANADWAVLADNHNHDADTYLTLRVDELEDVGNFVLFLVRKARAEGNIPDIPPAPVTVK